MVNGRPLFSQKSETIEGETRQSIDSHQDLSGKISVNLAKHSTKSLISFPSKERGTGTDQFCRTKDYESSSCK